MPSCACDTSRALLWCRPFLSNLWPKISSGRTRATAILKAWRALLWSARHLPKLSPAQLPWAGSFSSARRNPKLPFRRIASMRWQYPAETLRFFRKAAIELRTIASTTSHGADDLRRIASEIEADLERRGSRGDGARLGAVLSQPHHGPPRLVTRSGVPAPGHRGEQLI